MAQGQVRVRISGEGTSIVDIEDGVTTVTGVLDGREGGIVRVNGHAIDNPNTFRLNTGDVVDYAPVRKNG